MVRAKFRVASYETRLDRTEEIRTIKLSAVVGDSEENKKFFKWTPYAEINLGTVNQEVWKQLPLGTEVYVDFTPIEPTQTA